MVTIYAFTCLENGKAYVGCTAGKVAKRYREHKCNLNAGKHTEPLLMADWKLYGESRFSMVSVLQFEDGAPSQVKRALENFVMSRYKQDGLLYNLNESAFMPTRAAIAKGRIASITRTRPPHTEETRQKIRSAQLGVRKNHGAKISATKQAKKAMR